MSENRFYRSFWLQADLRLTSPMIIGNGVNNNSDNDLLIGLDGNPFIPGTSLAGVIKSGMKDNTCISQTHMDLLMGKEGDDSRQSMVILNDSLLKEDEQKVEVVVRDGIEINEYTKTAKNKSKYNFEVLNPGVVFNFCMEILIRERFKELPVLQFVRDFVAFAESGDFRVGAKTNRGYGQLKIENIKCYEVDFFNNKKWATPADAMKAYIAFDWSQLKTWEEFITEKKNAREKDTEEELVPEISYRYPYTSITVPLAVESTLLIRNYFLSNLDVDCEQLMVRDKAVIPGSAWAGCFRHKVKAFVEELSNKAIAKDMTKEIFGAEKDYDVPARSRVVFMEAEEIGDKKTSTKNVTRNKIDRFTGGVLKTALFSERIAVGGNYQLEVKLKDAKDYEIGLLLLAVQEIRHGLMAVGGTTSVGRGAFVPDGKISINSEELSDKKMQGYYKALQDELKERMED